MHSVDPDDAQWNGFGPDNVLGCVVYPTTEVIEPGVIKHIEGNRFPLVNLMAPNRNAQLRYLRHSAPRD